MHNPTVKNGFGIASNNDAFVDGESKVKTWQLDLLGNWAGGDSTDKDSVLVFEDEDGDLAFDSGVENWTAKDHHVTDAVNAITERYVDGAGTADVFAHDAAGNLIDDVTHEYTYDAWNRIVAVDDANDPNPQTRGISTYSYDALGRRINKTVANSGALNTAGAGDFFYYDGNRLLEHHHDSPTSGEDYLREYVWGLEYIDEAVAQYDTEPGQAAELFFILIDANYNVVAVVDAGNLVQQYSYWPYGTLLAVEDGTGATIDFETYPEQIATNVGHQGLYWDFETWLIHNRARAYDPELGRFMQRDPNETAQLLYTALLSNGSVALMFDLPIGAGGQYGDGMNLYAYLRLNPVSGVDPSGLWGFEDSIDDVLSDYFVERGWVQHQTLAEAKAMVGELAKTVQQMMAMLLAQMGAQFVADLVAPGMGEVVGLGFTGYHLLEALTIFARDPSWSSGANLLLNIKVSWNLARSVGVKGAAMRLRRGFRQTKGRYAPRPTHPDTASWYRVRNRWKGGREETFYHWNKHARELGATLEEYTDDALACWRQYRDTARPCAIDGGRGIGYRIKGPPGGIFTADGRIVTFWYD